MILTINNAVYVLKIGVILIYSRSTIIRTVDIEKASKNLLAFVSI